MFFVAAVCGCLVHDLSFPWLSVALLCGLFSFVLCLALEPTFQRTWENKQMLHSSMKDQARTKQLVKVTFVNQRYYCPHVRHLHILEYAD